jgi:hypothetical protein
MLRFTLQSIALLLLEQIQDAHGGVETVTAMQAIRRYLVRRVYWKR